jgi:predicted ATPase
MSPMVTYRLSYVGEQRETARDIFGGRFRLFNGAEYVGFVVVITPAPQMDGVLADYSAEQVRASQAAIAAQHVQSALEAGLLPLTDRTMSFEVRVGAAEVTSQLRGGSGSSDLDDVIITLGAAPQSDLLPIRPTNLSVRNIRSFDADGVLVDLEPLTVLIGPNGAGKSNLLESFELLRRLFSGAFHVSFRHRPVDDRPLAFHVGFEIDGTVGHYDVEFEVANIGAIVLSERCVIGDVSFLDRVAGRDTVYRSTVRSKGLSSGADVALQVASDRTALALVGSQATKELLTFRRMIDNVSVQRMFRRRDNGGGSPSDYYMNDDASNFVGVVQRLLSNGAARQELTAALREALGATADFIVDPQGWRVALAAETFSVDELSHGTTNWLRMIACLIDPQRPQLVCFDEPESGLHPDLVFRFLERASASSASGPVVIATHSADLLDHLHLRDLAAGIRVLENRDGATRARTIENELTLDDVREMLVGTAWVSGLLGGNPG